MKITLSATWEVEVTEVNDVELRKFVVHMHDDPVAVILVLRNSRPVSVSATTDGCTVHMTGNDIVEHHGKEGQCSG